MTHGLYWYRLEGRSLFKFGRSKNAASSRMQDYTSDLPDDVKPDDASLVTYPVPAGVHSFDVEQRVLSILPRKGYLRTPLAKRKQGRTIEVFDMGGKPWSEVNAQVQALAHAIVGTLAAAAKQAEELKMREIEQGIKADIEQRLRQEYAGRIAALERAAEDAARKARAEARIEIMAELDKEASARAYRMHSEWRASEARASAPPSSQTAPPAFTLREQTSEYQIPVRGISIGIAALAAIFLIAAINGMTSTTKATTSASRAIVPTVTTQGVPSTSSFNAHQFGQDWRAGINHDYVESKLLKGEWVTSDDYECRAVPISQRNAVNGETISINGKLYEIECRLK